MKCYTGSDGIRSDMTSQDFRLPSNKQPDLFTWKSKQLVVNSNFLSGMSPMTRNCSRQQLINVPGPVKGTRVVSCDMHVRHGLC